MDMMDTERGRDGRKERVAWMERLELIYICCSVAKSCPTLWGPHRLQPARLLYPWDFPGKNTGVGCRFLLQGIFLPRDGACISCIAGEYCWAIRVCTCVGGLHATSLQLCPILCDPVDCSPRLLCPWDSPGKNIGLGCHALLQGIFPTQGLNLSYISCIGRHVLYHATRNAPITSWHIKLTTTKPTWGTLYFSGWLI